jgi:beta-lactamase regulating signal transducer with metallopeptidase domain
MEHPPFSFFPYVVIPKKTFESGDYLEILAHEKAHIRQGHTFDLLFSELLIVFLWFNPFIWLIKRSMALNHEYLADKFSLRSSCSIKEYQYKLLNIPN